MKHDCRVVGTGSFGTVVALHSLGLDGTAFAPLCRCLSDEWRVITFDQRGHGVCADTAPSTFEDFVDDVLAVIRHEASRPVHLLGHSMGGAVAALAAARSSTDVASLSLVATPPMGMPIFAERGDLAMTEGMDAAIESTLVRWFHAEEAGEEWIYARQALSRMTAEGYAATWRAFAHFKGYSDLVAALPPTLLVAMECDASTPPSALEAIADSFRIAGHGDAVRLITIPDTGHMGVLTQPETFANALEQHWKRPGLGRA